MTKILTFAALLACGIGGAQAQTYAGGAIGITRSGLECGAASSCRRSDSLFRLMVGQAFKNGAAVEAGYTDLGQQRASLDGLAVDVQIKGLFAGMAYRLPMVASRRWHLAARAGVSQMSARTQANAGTASNKSLKPYLGVAGGYLVSQELRLELGLEASRMALTAPSGRETQSQFTAATVALLYAF